MRRLPLLSVLLLAGCDLIGGGSSADPPAEGQRPADGPDVLVLAFSGHEFNVSGEPWREPYLIRDGFTAELEASLGAAGLSVVTWDHGDELYDHLADGTPTTPDSGTDRVAFGFLSFVTELEYLRDTYIQGFDNPTQLIVVGHGHGAVWAHTGMQLVPDAPVSLLVDLDGDSTGWDSTPLPGLPADGWDVELLAFVEGNGLQWPFEAWRAVDSWDLPGIDDLQDIEDVVPASASWTLEVQGEGLLLRDEDDDHRMDGSEDGIERLATSLSHEALGGPGTEASAWVAERAAELLAP